MRPEDIAALPRREFEDYLLFFQLTAREEQARAKREAPRGVR